MKRQEYLKELREKKTLKELEQDLMSLRRDLNHKRMEQAAGKLKNQAEIFKMKRQLARTLTIMREKT